MQNNFKDLTVCDKPEGTKSIYGKEVHMHLRGLRDLVVIGCCPELDQDTEMGRVVVLSMIEKKRRERLNNLLEKSVRISAQKDMAGKLRNLLIHYGERNIKTAIETVGHNIHDIEIFLLSGGLCAEA